MTFTSGEVRTYYQTRMPKMHFVNGREWRGPCPVHQGKDPNFAVNAESGLAQCHSQCGRGWDMISLEMDLTGVAFPQAKDQVFEIVGRPKVPWEDRNIEATYDYTDAQGTCLYQVVREWGKQFKQRRPDGNGGWIWGIKGIRPVPYRLPFLADAKCVFVVEGEKDVQTLERLGLVGTCNNGGAGNFREDLIPYFAGKPVAILPDNDEPGRLHALKVAAMLAPVAASVKVVPLPGLPAKGDVTDFILAGGTLDQIRDCYRKAVNWTPEWEFPSDVPNEDDRYVRTIEQVVENSGGLTAFWDLTARAGLATPWPRLDKNLNGGMRAGEVYVIGANQGAGKTSLALQFAMAAMRHGSGVLLFSMEMNWTSVFQRMASIEARVDLLEFRTLQATKHSSTVEYFHRLVRATNELAQHQLQVSTKPSISPEYIVAETQRLAKRGKVDLVIVDHMQLMSADTTARGEYEKFTSISRAMKQTAMEVKVPLLLVSQTSRNNAKDKRFELEVSDLRGSGAIEEDAAGVFLLYEDKEDTETAKTEGGQRYVKGPLKSWLKLGKNRYGMQGVYMPLLHCKASTRFELIGDERQTSLEDAE